MPDYAFETVDVFTERRFGGNQLAVFTDARGLSDAEMQALAFEFNLSETTFILPPADPAITARVRIFNRATEMAFAGHPSIGTAYVMARAGLAQGDQLRLEVQAGIVAVELSRNAAGDVTGGKITAPQPLSMGRRFTAEEIASCIGIAPSDVIVTTHAPMLASAGNPYVFAELNREALTRAAPDINAFRAVQAAHAGLKARFSLHIYARDGADLRARMFAPLVGTWEDPATGSANAPLAGLLLHFSGARENAFVVRQGEEMGRPSVLHVGARREGEAIITTVAGACVPVLSGQAML